MKRTDLVAAISDKAGISKAAADRAVSVFVEHVVDAIKNEDEVALMGFGTFASAKRSERNGRNPHTGATIKIAARRVPVFRPGSLLKRAVEPAEKKAGPAKVVATKAGPAKVVAAKAASTKVVAAKAATKAKKK